SVEFIKMRKEHASRVGQLEEDVYDCCFGLYYKSISENAQCNQTLQDADNIISWEYNMHEFPAKNVIIQLIRNKYIYLHAFKKGQQERLEIKRKILLPDCVDQSKISAQINSSGVLTIS
ncbi:hypothetical protein KR018_010627, partial [Drosophila ironensis]